MNPTNETVNAELLEALKDLLAWANIKDGSGVFYLREKCEKAIAKAENNKS